MFPRCTHLCCTLALFASHTSDDSWLAGCFPFGGGGGGRPLPTSTTMRVEPKVFFANERTFLSWLHMAVTLGGIGSAGESGCQGCWCRRREISRLIKREIKQVKMRK